MTRDPSSEFKRGRVEFHQVFAEGWELEVVWINACTQGVEQRLSSGWGDQCTGDPEGLVALAIAIIPVAVYAEPGASLSIRQQPFHEVGFVGSGFILPRVGHSLP